jgi:hypothetical protein
MSVRVTALCWQIHIPITHKMVLLRLADYADDHGGKIFPSVATLAHDCEVSPRMVQYILKGFIADGLLLVVGNATGGRGKTRRYAIDLDRAVQMAGPGGGTTNGTGERVQRVQDDCALYEERVQTDAEKGATAIAPDPPGTVSVGGGARAPEVSIVVGGLTGLKATASNIATVEGWLAKGYDPQQDIYPAVVGALPTAKEAPGTFAYFTQPIDRRHAARISPRSNVRYLHRASGGGRGRGMSAGASDLLKAANCGIIEIGGLS